MKIRIKESYEVNEVVYKVQTKRGLFWKTVEKYVHLKDAIACADNLKIIDEYNNPKPKNPTLSFIGYGVRNNYATSGIAHSMDIYENYPTCKRGSYPLQQENIFWSGGKQLMSIHSPKLFDDLGLEPRKYKITIERIDNE
jgi:hypothetical protein